ncbi:hypothetical protein DEO72_LG8g2973 [Vigna unguiculata]|uniref:Uncharacterized protein n=1 Tax=Vigna unguiculata TaxID=3917 RepID=A0A4D6MWA1_VIGUN|nr:hypothetical protein DEO72_LG8g2973 [Vigna unguiculata]
MSSQGRLGKQPIGNEKGRHDILAQASKAHLSESSSLDLDYARAIHSGGVPRFWATCYLAQARGRSHPGEKSSPKPDFAVSHWSTLAQARKLSLSEKGPPAHAKASSCALMRTWIRRCCAMSGYVAGGSHVLDYGRVEKPWDIKELAKV